MSRLRFHAALEELGQPKADQYDGNSLIAPHFAYTPDLVPVSEAYACFGRPEQHEKWKPIAHNVERQSRQLYRKHNLGFHRNTNSGLFLAGNTEDLMNTDRDRMMILVMELMEVDCHLWSFIDEDVRAVLKVLDTFCGEGHGVCVRYYVRENWRQEYRPITTPNPLHGPPLSPLLDPYGQDHPSVRRIPRVRLPRSDTTSRQGVATPPTVPADSRAELALQRMAAREQSDAALFGEERRDAFGRTQREAWQHMGRAPDGSRLIPTSDHTGREAQRTSEEDTSRQRTVSESERLMGRYTHLANRIDRELQYNIEAQVTDYRTFTRLLRYTYHREEEDDASQRGNDGYDSDTEKGSDDESNDEGNQSDEEGDDERLQTRSLRRIDAEDLPAAMNRAMGYLMQMTREEHERHFRARSSA